MYDAAVEGMVRVLHWLAPSLVAASLGAVVAGLIEALGAGFGPAAALASAGYAAILHLPACLIGALVIRGLWAAWRPARLEAALIEEGGAAPRLAAWVVFLVAAGWVVVAATVAAVDTLADSTTFKVKVVAVVMPFVVLTTVGLLAAVSLPAVDGLTRALRALGGRALTPRRILAGALVVGAVLAVVARAWIERRVGHYDLGVLIGPVIAVAITGATHPVWRRIPSRLAYRAIAVPAAVATVAIAVGAIWVRAERPSLMLAIWSERTVAGLAIDTVFDIEELHGDLTREKARPEPRPGAPHRDVILVTIDTVRYDRTPLGGGSVSMPALVALAGRGAVFDRAYAPSNATRRSMTSLMLGASTSRVRGREVGWALRLDPRHITIAERFQRAGYDTAGFFCCEITWGRERRTGWSRGIDTLSFGRDSEIVDGARAWIEARYAAAADRPAFVWLHLIEPHRWVGGKDADLIAQPREDVVKRYDRPLARADELLGRLAAAIDAIPEARRPILVVTSDHGEGLGDHGTLHHGYHLHDSETRVPLVLVGPGIPSARIPETVSLTDLAPTLLDLAGFVPPGMPAMDGHSRADLVTGARAGDPEGGVAYLAMVKDRTTPRGARAVVRGRWKLIDGPRGHELYDTRSDPGELTDLAGERPELVAELEALLDAHAIVERTPAF